MSRASCRGLCAAWLALCLAAGQEEGQCDAGDASCHSDAGSLQWEPKTLSVVLPCAGEGEFARRTVQSVSDSVPGGSGGPILANIVVVDDGSTPPLKKKHLTKKFLEKYNVTLFRNKRTVGLIRAKSMGAAGARGDIIVFFDCHVAPQEGWYKEFLEEMAANYRRVVVPQITDLDIDTWTERNRHQSNSKCYLTWDADFKWFRSTRPEIPVLSGGLLGISRRWWNETGGYDEGMQGWGGENIDQSLRTWLCGGEIKSLSNAFVAHMWRVEHDPRTQPHYPVDVRDTLTNRVRAALGWFDSFAQKLNHYPEMRYFAQGRQDMSAFEAVRERLGCRPFAWFLWRFRDIYEDAGLLPNETFRIRHRKTDLCLTYLGPAGTHPQGSDRVELRPCGEEVPRQQHGWPNRPPDPQRWHKANQDPALGSRCCNGLRVWSTDQCLGFSGGGTTSVCDIAGVANVAAISGAERWPNLAPGQLVLARGCLDVVKKKLVLVQCKTAEQVKTTAKPTWQEEDPSKPLETQLYERAKEDHPDIFSKG